MEQQFIVLHKSNPVAWALMPHALNRIKRFAVKYETDTEPEALAALVEQHFVSEEPLLLVIVAYQSGEGVFAHALACIDDILGKRFLTIMQFETDIVFEDRSELSRMLKQFEVWGQQHNATEVRLVTMDESHVRLFQRYYGFKKHRISMNKPLLEG